jgi:predicted Zn finger-like uncharacterized protein
MQSPQAQTVVITCPNCGTRYQVTPDTLGDAGRKVSCAECGKAWLATATPPAPPPPPLAPADEDQLDAAFAVEQAALIEAEADREIEAEAATDEPAEAPARPMASPAQRAQKKAEGRFRRRQRQVENGLPVARLRHFVRIGAVVALVGVSAGLYFLRVEMVRLVPDLAGLYATLGLGVNTVGLDFADVSTVLSRREGVDVLGVTGSVYSVSQRSVPVPPVLVEIRDGNGHALYQWGVTPELRTLAPGEAVRIATELAAPPTGARTVHLSFATGNGGTASASPEHSAEAGHGSADAPAAADHSPAATTDSAAPDHGEAAHEISPAASEDAAHSSEALAGH